MKTVEKRLADPDLATFDNTIDYNKMLSIIYMFENVKDVFILDGDKKIIGIKEPSSTNGGSRRRRKTRRRKQTRKQTKRKKQTRKYMF